MSVYDTVHLLAKELKECDEYVNCIEFRNKVKSNNISKGILDEMNEYAMDLQQKSMHGVDINNNELQKLEELQNKAEKNEDIFAYFEAKSKFEFVLDEISRIISDEIEI